MEHYSALKRKEILTQATTRTGLEDIMFMKSTSHKEQVLNDFTYMRPLESDS